MSEPQEYRVIPFKGLRGIIARRMQESVAQKPHVTLFAQAESGQLEAALRALAPAVEQEGGARLSITGLLVKLTASALKAYPRINGRVEGGEIRLYQRVNVGVAVALEEGLTVPVIQEPDAKSLATIASELTDKAGRARRGKLHPAELMDGTFTLSTLGAYGVTYFTPIINPPEIAILGIGNVTAGHLHLSLSFDHAAIDGAQAATFLKEVIRRVEQPRDFLA